MLSFLAHFLFVLAAWTVVIKYLFPMAYTLAEGTPIGTHVYWDFWPIFHVWLGWALLRWQRYSYALALVVSVAEIAIVAVKLVAFLGAPQWTIWDTNWFINKLFVLACFVLLLGYLLINARELRARSAQPVRAAASA